MIERIKEIIAFLMDPDRSDIIDRVDIHDTLSSMGYSNEEIHHALELIDFEGDVEDQPAMSRVSEGVRVLSESEKSVLSTDAQGHLLMLQRLGWLSEVQLNLIIESAALEYSRPVSLDEIKEMSTRFVSDLPDKISPDAYQRDNEPH